MVLLRWRGKKRTESGFTILEIALSAILFMVLLASMITVHRKRVRDEIHNQCADRQWRWMKVSDEIEFQFRRWEMLAPVCISTGFNPVETLSDGRIRFWEIDSTRPLIRPMKLTNYLEIPYEQFFASDQRALVCDQELFANGKIAKVNPTNQNQPTVVEFRFDQEEHASRMFGEGSMLAAMNEVFFETGPSEVPKQRALTRRIGDKNRKDLVAGFETFSITSELKDETKEMQVEIRFEQGDCKFQRPFLLTGASHMENRGQWLLGSKQVFFKPWFEEATNSEMMTP